MVFGAVAAIGQSNLKRLIAYSSIGHMGYALAGLASGTNQSSKLSNIYFNIFSYDFSIFFMLIYVREKKCIL